MKAIILAAGKGSRISDDIGPVPKSTLKINDKPIIRNTVERLLKKDIEVIVCTGYRHNIIEKCLLGLNVTFVNNPFYDVTNNIASLWFAKDYIDGDVMILSADVVFDDALLQNLIDDKGNLVMVTDSSRVQDGDYFFNVDNNGKLVEYGPSVDVSNRTYEYVGLDKISSGSAVAFKEKLLSMIDNGETQCYFEYIFFSFINSKKHKLSFMDATGCIWREIDRIDDYHKAIKEFN